MVIKSVHLFKFIGGPPSCVHYCIECRVVDYIWRCSLISFQYVSIWCLRFDPHRTTYQSESRGLIKKRNQITHAYLSENKPPYKVRGPAHSIMAPSIYANFSSFSDYIPLFGHFVYTNILIIVKQNTYKKERLWEHLLSSVHVTSSILMYL